MFFNKNDNETDFCESYKSQVLDSSTKKKGTSLFGTLIKLLTILILLAIIIAVSIYGYNYYLNAQKVNNLPLPPVSVQISDEDLIVEDEDTQMEEEELNGSKVNKRTTDVKSEISKSKVETNSTKEEVESLEVPTATSEAKYLEELADLSKEIDKERKK